ncbi:FtsX-like permease family protein [uncultured Clostridium sp.]|uniref:FtsX-like permease family protein n=1 Tax=uncultured Clostridium sp. TaxID=59620 RepID=UPI0025F5114D|nr:hypothetical protein [uncultured Clostridium sp.]
MNNIQDCNDVAQDFKKFIKQMIMSTDDSQMNINATFENFEDANTTMLSMASVFLIIFSVIIVIILLLVLRFRISNDIEENMINIGALEVLGYTSSEILRIYIKESIPDEIKKNAGVYCSDIMFKVDFDNDKLILSTVDEEVNKTQEYVYTKEGYFVSTNGNYISLWNGIASPENGSVGNTKLYFKTKPDGGTWIYIQNYETYPGLSHTAEFSPYAEKIEENNVSDNIMEAWRKRNNKKYYLNSEKYTSAYYLLKNRITMKINLSETMNGYLKAKE